MNKPMSNVKPLSKMLGEMAVLAKVNVACLGQTRLDKTASADSDRAHGAKLGAAQTTVNRLPGAEAMISAIKQKHTEGRAICSSLTTQWGDDRRLLMNALIGEFAGAMQDCINEHDKLVEKFVADAPAYIANAQKHLGSYDVRPPTIEEISRAFSLAYSFAPVPDASAYTTGDSSLEQHLKARFEADVQEHYAEAQRDMMQRLAEPLENLVDRMAKYDERQKKKADGTLGESKAGIFKSGVVTNINAIAKIVRASNIMGDPFLTDLAVKLEAFQMIEHKDLISSKELRAEMARRAGEIRASLGGWL